MKTRTALQTVSTLSLVGMLGLAGCGGSTTSTADLPPDPMTPSPDPMTPSPDPMTPSPDPMTPSPDPMTPSPVTLDEERRARILAEGNGPIIEGAAFDDIISDTGSLRVEYDWDGSELAIDIYDSEDPSLLTVSLSSDSDLVASREQIALSGTNIPNRTRREFQVGQSIGNRDTIGRIGVDYQSDTAWFAYGYWLTVDHDDEGNVVADTGAFSTLLNYFPIGNFSVEGTATYVGNEQASGLHTVTYSGGDPDGDGDRRKFNAYTNEFRIAHFVGDVMLKADFDSGVIDGTIHNIHYPEPEENYSGPLAGSGGQREFEVDLEQGLISSDGYFYSSVKTNTTEDWRSSRPDIVESGGHWAGQFFRSSVSRVNTQPRAVAGTFATWYAFDDVNDETGKRTIGTYVGSFSAGHCADAGSC